ncbi:unnamed protein product [Lactuca saligna]|uniref:Uncharacterized protein n=1 Tax=Lactuca saligna TaxID=75948 RepID=A0AA36EP33_LACSI|nr:unnamed protein product [Lactuca saligna]
MLKLLEKALIILSSLNREKIEDGQEVAVEEVEDEQSKMEGMASIALLLDGSISGHFVQLPESVYYQMGHIVFSSRLHISLSGKNMEEVVVVVELITKLHEGCEEDVKIISTVIGIESGYIGFLARPQRENVALIRARQRS